MDEAAMWHRGSENSDSLAEHSRPNYLPSPSCHCPAFLLWCCPRPSHPTMKVGRARLWAPAHCSQWGGSRPDPELWEHCDTLLTSSPILQPPNPGAFMSWQLNLSVSRTGEKRAVSLWARGFAALVVGPQEGLL